jgi:hypothetical protein
VTAPDAASVSQRVGEAEQDRFVSRIWQAMRLLETALQEWDGEGWELVLALFSGLFAFYGTAVQRRPAARENHSSGQGEPVAASGPAGRAGFPRWIGSRVLAVEPCW